jgi:hypothetical protein
MLEPSAGPTVGKARSPFIRKLWAMLQDSSLSHVIGWERDGRSFEVKDAKKMEKAVLPQFFKSHLLKSFQRQLNYFGFLKTSKSSMIYALPLFCRDDPQSVLLIKRKVNTGNLRKRKYSCYEKDEDEVESRRDQTCRDEPEHILKRPTHTRSGRAITWRDKETEQYQRELNGKRDSCRSSSSSSDDEASSPEESGVIQKSITPIGGGRRDGCSNDNLSEYGGWNEQESSSSSMNPTRGLSSTSSSSAPSEQANTFSPPLHSTSFAVSASSTGRVNLAARPRLKMIAKEAVAQAGQSELPQPPTKPNSYYNLDPFLPPVTPMTPNSVRRSRSGDSVRIVAGGVETFGGGDMTPSKPDSYYNLSFTNGPQAASPLPLASTSSSGDSPEQSYLHQRTAITAAISDPLVKKEPTTGDSLTELAQEIWGNE